MSVPLISIVIPCFNHGKYLDECLQSVLAYPHHDQIEIILVNDGSDDAFTMEKIKAWKHPILTIINQENKGLTASRNAGIRIARANLIMNLDSDNKLETNFIANAIKTFQTQPEIDVLYPNKILFNDTNSKKTKVSVEFFHIRKLLLYNFIDACAVFKKSIWEKTGGFDERLSVLEDWDFWLSCYENGANFFHLKKYGFYYRVNPQSMIHGAKKENLKKAVHYIHAKHSDMYAEHINEIGYALRYTLKKPFRHLIRVLLGKPFLLSPHN